MPGVLARARSAANEVECAYETSTEKGEGGGFGGSGDGIWDHGVGDGTGLVLAVRVAVCGDRVWIEECKARTADIEGRVGDSGIQVGDQQKEGTAHHVALGCHGEVIRERRGCGRVAEVEGVHGGRIDSETGVKIEGAGVVGGAGVDGANGNGGDAVLPGDGDSEVEGVGLGSGGNSGEEGEESKGVPERSQRGSTFGGWCLSAGVTLAGSHRSAIENFGYFSRFGTAVTE